MKKDKEHHYHIVINRASVDEDKIVIDYRGTEKSVRQLVCKLKEQYTQDINVYLALHIGFPAKSIFADNDNIVFNEDLRNGTDTYLLEHHYGHKIDRWW